jgi:hypothetical protein
MASHLDFSSSLHVNSPSARRPRHQNAVTNTQTNKHPHRLREATGHAVLFQPSATATCIPATKRPWITPQGVLPDLQHGLHRVVPQSRITTATKVRPSLCRFSRNSQMLNSIMCILLCCIKKHSLTQHIHKFSRLLVPALLIYITWIKLRSIEWSLVR